MSAFSEQLRVALDAAEMSQSEFAELTKISQPTISRYLKGDIVPEAEVFGTLLDALPDTLHFELLVARLTDALPRKYRDAVTILAQGATTVREGTAYAAGPKLAKDLRAAIDYLTAEAVQEPPVRELILTLARALGADQASLESSGSALDKAIEDENRRRAKDKRDRKSS